MRSKDVKRKIYYYDVEIKGIVEGNKKHNKEATVDFKDITEKTNTIKTLFNKIKKSNDAYNSEKNNKRKQQLFKDMCISITGSTYLCIMIDQMDDDQIRFRILQTKDNALPYIEANGEISKLTDILKYDFNMVEVTHCILFLKSQILGAEFNFYGARPSAIATYINMKNKGLFMRCVSKIKNEFYQNMVEDGEYTLLEIAVRNNATMKRYLIDHAGIIGRYFDDINDSGTIQIKMNRKKNQRNEGFKIPWKDGDELRDFVLFNKEDIKKFKLRKAEETDPVDVLNDKLVHTVTGIETINRVVDSNSMYMQIEGFYNENIAQE